MQIESLLNPASSPPTRRQCSKLTRSTTYHEPSSSYSPEPTPSKRASSKKMPKDAPKWDEGPTVGQVRYRPFDLSASQLAKLRDDFKFYAGPKGDMRIYPEHIPYSSDKKEFLAKTGREAFEVFHYTFRYKDGSEPEKDWVVMWDYNIGLVRITPFFKCMPGHRKTDPKNAIQASAGLADLCHSITGGAILAQGYWLPFAAALALASTFSYNIRHALVPIFGPTFPSTCVHPSSHLFKQWSIPASIVTSCADEVRSWTSLPAKKARASGANIDAAEPSSTGRNLRRKSRLRPRDIGVYDASDLDADDAESESDADNESTSESTSQSTTPSLPDDSDYAATPPTTIAPEITKPTWTTANRPLYPTPAHSFPSATPTSGARRRTDSESISPLTTTSISGSTSTGMKRKRLPSLVIPAGTDDNDAALSDPSTITDDEGPNAAAELYRAITASARKRAAAGIVTTTSFQKMGQASDMSESSEVEEKRKVNRKRGRFYADEFGAAQALMKMSEISWGGGQRV